MQSKTAIPIDYKNYRCLKCGSVMQYLPAWQAFKERKGDNTMMLVCKKDDIYCTTRRSNAGKVYLESTPADAKLRALRQETHFYFDKLYIDGILPGKDSAYQWLSEKFGFQLFGKLTYRHIGEFDDFYCKKAIEYILQKLCENAEKLKHPLKFYEAGNQYVKNTSRLSAIVDETNKKFWASHQDLLYKGEQ